MQLSDAAPAKPPYLNTTILMWGSGIAMLLLLAYLSSHQPPFEDVRRFTEHQREAARTWLIVDCLFAVVYSTFFSLLCRRAASRARQKRTRGQGRKLRWLIPLFGLFDLAENLILAAGLSGNETLSAALPPLRILKWGGPVIGTTFWLATHPRRRLIAQVGGSAALMLVLVVFVARFAYSEVSYFAPQTPVVDTNEWSTMFVNLTNRMALLGATNRQANLYGAFAQNLQWKASFISNAFVDAGYHPVYQSFTVDSNKYSFGRAFTNRAVNIIAEKTGSNSNQLILLGAHYDTMAHSQDWTGVDKRRFYPEEAGTPGANDNSSGVASLLEVARLLSRVELKHTVRFVAFANEEPPFFQQADAMGSWQLAHQYSTQQVAIRVMISLDALAVYNPTNRNSPKRAGLNGLAASCWGLPDESSYVAFMSNWQARSGPEAKEWAKTFARHSPIAVRTASLPFLTGEYFAWSDDWSFTQHGYPAFTITDTAFYRSARYHEADDTFSNLTGEDFKGLTDVVYGLSRTVREMAGR